MAAALAPPYLLRLLGAGFFQGIVKRYEGINSLEALQFLTLQCPQQTSQKSCIALANPVCPKTLYRKLAIAATSPSPAHIPPTSNLPPVAPRRYIDSWQSLSRLRPLHSSRLPSTLIRIAPRPYIASWTSLSQRLCVNTSVSVHPPSPLHRDAVSTAGKRCHGATFHPLPSRLSLTRANPDTMQRELVIGILLSTNPKFILGPQDPKSVLDIGVPALFHLPTALIPPLPDSHNASLNTMHSNGEGANHRSLHNTPPPFQNARCLKTIYRRLVIATHSHLLHIHSLRSNNTTESEADSSE